MRKKRILTRMAGCIMAFVLLFTGILSFYSPDVVVKAEEPQSSTSKVIHMVMDNSQSVYYDTKARKPLKRWCQIVYAMEVFASMMNYEEGDVLKIYPMHDVTVDGQKIGELEALTIDSKDDVALISKIDTNADCKGTPFETVQKAYDDLKNNYAGVNQKWLIVLSDGVFTKKNAKGYLDDIDDSVTESKLKEFNKDVDVINFKINGTTHTPDDDDNTGYYLFATADDSAGIIKGLIDASNKIFKRDEFPNDHIKNGNRIDFDVTMKRIFVFVQGEDADKEITLDGKSATNVSKMKYSEFMGVYGRAEEPKGTKREPALIDTSLKGTLAIFEGVEEGVHELNIDPKAENCLVCYEVDIGLVATLTDESGQQVKLPAKSIPSGKYYIDYYLADNKTGKNVESSEFVGPFTLHNAKFILGENEKDLTDPDNQPLDLSAVADEQSQLIIEGEYGNKVKYPVNTDDTKDLWTFKVKNETAIEIDLDKKQDFYQLRKLEKGEGIIAKIKINGKELSDKELETVKIDVVSNKNVGYTTEILSGQSAYLIKFNYYNDSKKNTDTGVHKLTITAMGKDNLGEEVSISRTTSIKIRTYPWWLPWLIFLLITAAATAITVFIMTRKVLPKNITFDPENTGFAVGKAHIDNEPNGRFRKLSSANANLDIKSPSFPENPTAQCGMALKLEAVDQRRVSSKKRSAMVTSLTVSNINITTVEVGGHTFERNKKDMRFYEDDAPLNEVLPFKIKNGTLVSMSGSCEKANGRGKASVTYETSLIYK